MRLALYHQYRPGMKSGDAIQWKSNSFIGFQIQQITGHDVNHTSLIVDVNEYDRKFQLEALAPGIMLTAISQRLEDHDGEAWWLPLKSEFENKREFINRIAFTYIGKRYDYRDLFKQIFSRVKPDPERLFCSEFAYLVWLSAGLELDNPDGWAPRPGDIPELGIFKNEVKL